MSLFSKQQWFCTACGKEQFSVPSCGYGSKYKCCDKRCYDEMMMRDTSSMLGLPYEPWSKGRAHAADD